MARRGLHLQFTMERNPSRCLSLSRSIFCSSILHKGSFSVSASHRLQYGSHSPIHPSHQLHNLLPTCFGGRVPSRLRQDTWRLFFAQYSNSTLNPFDGDLLGWSLTACMPVNISQSPWRSTRDRQDFSEEIFLNITVPAPFSPSNPLIRSLLKITVNANAEYFELPNYMNGGVAGPLLDEDPTHVCGHNCNHQSPNIDDPDD